MMLISASLGAASSITGLYLSYYLNIASGAAIVLVATGFFLLAYLVSPRRGLLANWFRRSQLRIPQDDTK
jgi:manganese/iron transport system permease protein